MSEQSSVEQSAQTPISKPSLGCLEYCDYHLILAPFLLPLLSLCLFSPSLPFTSFSLSLTHSSFLYTYTIYQTTPRIDSSYNATLQPPPKYVFLSSHLPLLQRRPLLRLRVWLRQCRLQHRCPARRSLHKAPSRLPQLQALCTRT